MLPLGSTSSVTSLVVPVNGAYSFINYAGGQWYMTASNNLANSVGTLSVTNGGTGVTTSTGSGNVVLSASPTFTGTVLGAAATWTGEDKAADFNATGLTGATAASRYVGATTSGAPVSGTFAVGDFIIDQTGSIYICTTAGTPGTWTQAGGGGGGVTASDVQIQTIMGALI